MSDALCDNHIYNLFKAKNSSYASLDHVVIEKSTSVDEEKYLQWQVTEVTLHIIYIIIYHILFSNGEKYSQWQGTGETPRKTSPPGTLLSPPELEYPEMKGDCNFEQILHFEISNMAIIVWRDF